MQLSAFFYFITKLKILLILCLILICLILTGCGKKDEKTVLKEFQNKVDNSDSYYLSGNMELVNNEDVYTYDISVSYKKDDYYKIELTNVINNHKQIILRNEEGVYIVTPSLNKSFKFQSDWPYNNSQIYLLQTLLSDIKNSEYTFTENDNEYIFTTDVTYSNDKKLVKQDIKFDKNLNIKSVDVYDSSDNIKMKMIFNNVDMNKNYDTNYFSLGENMGGATTSTSGNLNDIIYPMYVPSDTYLTSKEIINTEVGKRVILTFSGEKPFTFVQENCSNSDVTILIDGDFVLLNDSLGNVTEKEVSWISNGIEYYITSDVLNTDEMIEIAKSVGLLAVSK